MAEFNGKGRRDDLFKRLTQLFRGGPSVKKKVRAFRTPTASTAVEVFKKSYSQVYSNALNAYGQYDRMSSSMNTLVAVPLSRGFISLKELASMYPNGERFLVYAYDHKQGHIVPAWAHHPRQTGIKTTVKVTFDDGSYYVCTPDHECMLRDGSYRNAEDLKPGDSMMPFYRKQFNGASKEDGKKFHGYRSVYTCGPMDGSWHNWMSEHRMIAEWYYDRKLKKNEEHVHHKDHDPENNDPLNLEFVNAKDHLAEHGKMGAKVWETHREKMIAGIQRAWDEDDGSRASKVAEVNRRVDVREKRRKHWSTNNPTQRLDVIERAKKTRALTYAARTVEEREKHSLSISLAHSEGRLTTSENFSQYWKDRPRSKNVEELTLEKLIEEGRKFSKPKLEELATHLGMSGGTLGRFIVAQGFSGWKEFKQRHLKNHKVMSVEPNGVVEVGDLTVDGYENFATDTIFTHNSRYADFSEMEYTPEISSAVDIYAEESTSVDDRNVVLHVYSNNPKIHAILSELYHDTINVEHNLTPWTRNLPVAWDTQIPLLDGRTITIKQLAEEVTAGKESWVYSIQDGTHRVVPGRVRWCGLTREAATIQRTWLDDGSYVDTTPDHEFVMRDGSSRRADALHENDSLMPFYRRVSSKTIKAEGVTSLDRIGGYEKVYDPGSDEWVYTHVRVNDELHERPALTEGNRFHVTHHVDFDKRNNDPGNLVWMGDKEHIGFHGDPTLRKSLGGSKPRERAVTKDEASIGSPRNHKVIRTEILAETKDAYCMEVLGPKGEHDRHNFMVVSAGSASNGICLQNCKYGDFFLFIDISPDVGVVNVFPMPVNEVERDEGWDPTDPMAVRFRWVTQGNQILESWQVAHFRLMGNDAFLPYGSSILESARRIWRQLILIEDAMLVYRVVRSPERRVFYIDVGTVPTEEIPNYMEAAQTKLKRSPVIDKASGRIDLRYNPLCNRLNTLIFLQDGRVLQLGDLIKEWDAGKRDQWVYSIDRENDKLVPGKVVWAGVTRKDADLVRVHLDNGTWVDTTPDHKFMLRDKSYVNAVDLKPNDALMPLYKTWSSKDDGHSIIGYERTYDPFKQTYEFTHRNNVIIEKGFDAIKGRIVHHADFDKRNNNPTNLVPMTWKDHMKLHGDEAVQRNKSPAGRACSKRTMEKTWANGKISSETFITLWKDPETRKKRINKLTLKINDEFMGHCMRVMQGCRGLSTTETEFRNKLNSDASFVSYLTHLNPTFKNGFNDKLSKSHLQSLFKGYGIKNAFTEFKRKWLLEHTNIENVIQFCMENNCDVGRKDVLKRFSLTKAELEEIVKLAGLKYADFSAQYMRKTLRYRAGYKNHKVIKVEILSFKEDTGCITVEKYHNFMTAGSAECFGPSVDVSMLSTGVAIKNSVDEDYFIPVRGSETGTRIDTLAGGQHVSDIADVEYIQKKLFAALKVPRAYLGYDESLSSKATLAQEDIRFSRSISRIQRVLISELQKIGMIHLFAHGFEGEDLTDFQIHLSNPSTQAQMQKLELWRTKFEIAGTVPEGLTDRDFLRREIFQLTDEQIEQIEDGKKRDRLIDLELEASELEGNEPGGPGGGGGGGLGGLGGGGGGEDLGAEEGGEEPPAGAGAGEGEPGGEEPAGEAGGEEDLFAGESHDDQSLLTAGEEPDQPGRPSSSLGATLASMGKKHRGKGPVTTTPLARMKYNRSRLKHHGPAATNMPFTGRSLKDFIQSNDDPFDKRHFRKDPFGEHRLLDSLIDADVMGVGNSGFKLSAEMKSTLASLGQRLDSIRGRRKQPQVILESESEGDVDVTIEEDAESITESLGEADEAIIEFPAIDAEEPDA